MKRIATFITAIVLVIVAGLVHGFWSDRWQPSPALDRAARRVSDVPMRIGDWEGQDLESDRSLYDLAGAKNYIVRSYTHVRSKASVLVILMCGRPGKMSVHTPEVCYRGAGYELAGAPQPWSLTHRNGANLGAMWTAQFAKEGDSRSLRLYWGWSADGDWQAAAAPRWHFRSAAALYKLYVSHESARPAAPSADSPVHDFMTRFAAAANEALFAVE